MLSKTRSPKPAVKQQALGTAPAEGLRRAFSEGRQHTPLPTSCIGKEPAGPGSFEKDWSQAWQGNGTALCSKPSQLTKGETREKGKVPWLKAVGAKGVMQSFPPSLSGGLCVLANCTREWGEGGSCLGPQRRLFLPNERHPSFSVLLPLESKPCLLS